MRAGKSPHRVLSYRLAWSSFHVQLISMLCNNGQFALWHIQA